MGAESCRSGLCGGTFVRIILKLLSWSALIAGGATPAVIFWTAPAFAQSGDELRSFAIPSQSLTSAIDAFIRVTGWQVGYSSQVAAGVRSPGVSGTMAPATALGRLLGGTGVVARMTGPNTATLFGPSAQAGESEGDLVAGTIVLDTITVSGEKVDRSLQQTYTAVTVVGEQQVKDFEIPNVRQAIDYAPNSFASSSSRGENGIVIRGMNSEGVTVAGNDSPVISYIVDGASLNGDATRRGVRSLWDVESVEILRGPQSALQGRNALAGAVVINTKDPTMYWEGAVEGMVGTDEMRSGAFMLSGPLVPGQLAFRVAGHMHRSEKDIRVIDGSGTNDPTLGPLVEDEFSSFRGKLLFTPDSLPGYRALLAINYGEDKPSINTVSGPDFFARTFNYDPLASALEFRTGKVLMPTADISYEFRPGWIVRSVSAYTASETEIFTPQSSQFIRDETRKGRDFTQDLRLEITDPASRMSGVVGLSYGHFKNDADGTIFVPPILGTTPLQDLTRITKNTSVAAYADLRYRLTDRWSLLAGGRIGRDTVHNRGQASGVDPDFSFPYAYMFDAKRSYNVVLPKIGLSFELTPTQTIAFTRSEGFRGGYTEIVTATGEINEVKPEYLTAYELAYRSSWLDDRLQFNSNFFWYDYQDQQVVVDNLVPHPIGGPDINVGITKNAGKSHLYGAEFEARWRATEALTVFAGLGLLKTKFDSLVTSTGDFSGNEFPEAPTVTFNAGAIYKHASGWFASADVRYTDGYYSVRDIANTPIRWVHDYVVANAALGFEARNFMAVVFVKNLFDKQYLTSISTGATEASIGEGRTFGAKLNARF